jgi:hypothetical protein
MIKNRRGILIGITFLFVALIAINHYSPKPVDWTLTCNISSKTPYGCYILNDLFGTLFPRQSIEYNEDGFFTSLDSNQIGNKNVIVITAGFNPDKYDLGALLKYAAKGNDLFVSSANYGRLFLDTMKIKLSSPIIDSSIFRNNRDRLILLNPNLQNDTGFHYNKKLPLVSIASFDTIHSLKLGTDKEGNLNFICTKYGSGKIYFHTQPLVFTNYHLLNGNAEYAAKALSYLPIRSTVWDNYYKPDRFVNSSPMRYILSQPPLQSAYYLLLITLLLYMAIESKRRQRVIPVVKPLENRSLQFIKTIGSLYFKQRNNADLAKKLTLYFKEYLREHYFLTGISGTVECVGMVSAKSGVPADLVQKLLGIMDSYESAHKVSDGELIGLNRDIEMFYKQCL